MTTFDPHALLADPASTCTQLLTPADASLLVQKSIPFIAAGHENLLKEIPRGPWIGGTSPLLITHQGVERSSDRLAISVLPGTIENLNVCTDTDIFADPPRNGEYEFTIIPAFSEAHRLLSIQGSNHPEFIGTASAGFIAGFDLSASSGQGKAFFGPDGSELTNAGVRIRMKAPAGYTAEADIISLEKADPRSPVIIFPENCFDPDLCRVNGQERHLAEVIGEHGHFDGILLVRDIGGGYTLNVSLGAGLENGSMKSYGVVRAGAEYRLSAPMTCDYVREFASKIGAPPLIATNCVLNAGKITGDMGAIQLVTFGEVVGRDNLNQTCSMLRILKEWKQIDIIRHPIDTHETMETILEQSETERKAAIGSLLLLSEISKNLFRT